MEVASRSSRITAEYDASGQVIISEAGGKYSLRSRTSADSVSKSAHGHDDARSLGSANRPGRTNDDRLPRTPVVQADPNDHPITLESPQSTVNPRYRRHSNTVGNETIMSAGTVSTTASSLQNRIGRRRRDENNSDDSNTTRYSEFSHGQAKRGGGRRRKHRKKKHKGRSIDKHSDSSAARRYSASDMHDVGGPDNEYWRELVAEQRRRSSLDSRDGRRSHSRRGSTSSSPRRRHRIGSSDGDKYNARPPRANGTSPAPSVGSGTSKGSMHFDGDSSVRQSGRRKSSISVSNEKRSRCNSVLTATAIFVVIGCLLLIIGVIRIFISFWHEFGSSVWAGALVSVHVLSRHNFEINCCHDNEICFEARWLSGHPLIAC